jgi:hypothetical protein
MTAMLDKNYFLFALVLGGLAGGCGLDPSGAAAVGAGGSSGAGASGGTVLCSGGYGQIICDGSVAKMCDGKGGITSSNTCSGNCQAGVGCVTCAPNASSCSGGVAKSCDAEGRESTFACDGPGMRCDPSGCSGACAPNTLGSTSQGCDFWPTVTANPVWSDPTHATQTGAFHFGVLVGNVSPTSATATLTVTIGGTPFKSAPFNADGQLRLAPGEVRLIPLDWVSDLKGPDWANPFLPVAQAQSVKKSGGAYHIVSDQPILAYQFSPIEALVHENQCPRILENAGGCYSYSTDASMLIPSHVLADDYVVAGYRGWHQDASVPAASRLNIGDFLTITALQSNTSVRITPRAGQTILAGVDGSRNGAPFTLSMGAGDVVQLFTPGSADTDSFSGTLVQEMNGHQLQLLSGVGCGTVPAGTGPCGHFEDPVLPRASLGNEYVVPAILVPQIGGTVVPMPYTLRIQAASDGTDLTFEPASMYKNVTLNSGEVLEIQGTLDGRISSSTPFAVTQYLNGGDPTLDQSGPTQISVTPRSQFQSSFSFLAPTVSDTSGFSNNVAIMAPTGTMVKLDGEAIQLDKFLPVGASGMSVEHQPLNLNSQVHVVSANRPVGVLVYGTASYTSYAYAAAQSFKRSADANP